MRKFIILSISISLAFLNFSCQENNKDLVGGAMLSDLIKPIDGRSMRSTSSKTDEDGKLIPHNADNSRVMPGASKVVLEAEGPGLVKGMRKYILMAKMIHQSGVQVPKTISSQLGGFRQELTPHISGPFISTNGAL